jgi:hypothetical protein
MIGDFTFVNNVLFNWVHRTVDGGDHRSEFNIINNYLKPGPATPKGEPIAWRFLKPESERSRTVVDNFGTAYVSGNIAEGNERASKDNWDGGVQPESQAPVGNVLPKIRRAAPIAHAPLTVHSAREAYDLVLANAGATLPRRDAVDERIVRSVRTGEVNVNAEADIREKLGGVGYSRETIDRIVGLIPKGIITHPSQVGGYPAYTGEPYQDADSDGMPDEWEKKSGLNPNSAGDASEDLNGDGYTNIEDYINGLDPRGPKVDWTDLRNNVDRRNRT